MGAALEKPLPYPYFTGDGSVATRQKEVESLKVLFGSLGTVLQEPPPSQIEWYEREREFYYKYLGGDFSLENRALSFVRSEEFAHIYLYYILRRMDVSINLIIEMQSQKEIEHEMVGWLSLATEMANCADIPTYADRLVKADKMPEKLSEKLKLLCSIVGPGIGRKVLLPFYNKEYIEPN